VLAIVHHVRGDQQKSEEALQNLIESHSDDYAYQVGVCFAVRGEADTAFVWLDRAFKNRDPALGTMRVDPYLVSLHGDPRWQPFVAKLGLAS
jgi:hypothetical protein